MGRPRILQREARSCLVCSSSFEIIVGANGSIGRKRCCSRQCANTITNAGKKKPTQLRRCAYCDKEFVVKRGVNPKKRHCSHQCANQATAPIRATKISESLIRNTYAKGMKHTEELKAKMSARLRGNNYRLGIPHTVETLRQAAERMKGSKNHQYVDGFCKERHGERRVLAQQLDYKLWRKTVFERDDFTCQICGRRGGKLQADHIKPWASYPELRFDVSNGRTLCVSCHRQTDTYGSNSAKGKRPCIP